MYGTSQARVLAASLCVFVLATTVAAAQDAIEVIKPVEGTSPILRDAPPGILLGAARGQANEHDKYMVIEGRRVQVFFDFERWLRVVPLDESNSPSSDGPYWVRWGKVGEGPSEFIQVDICERLDPQDCRNLREQLAADIGTLAQR